MDRISFCDGWLFRKRGGENRMVDLPHDAMQEAPRQADAPSGRGSSYYVGEYYIYEKNFIPAPHWKDKEIWIEFEGVSPKSEVLLNGVNIGGCLYGYTRYRLPLKDLRYGETNTLTVIADNTQMPNSRWYAGAGIYRPVWLLTAPLRHLPLYAVKVTTLCHDPARIRVDIQCEEETEPEVQILDGENCIASGAGRSVELEIPNAKLWSTEHPYLYSCCVRWTENGKELDAESVRFGIRTLRWTPEGLFVNGRSVKLKGGCIHHDHGILGARTYAEAEYKRIQKLKEFGFNAIRSAHNPAAPAMLDACDELGMYVMDEGWDTWTRKKNQYDYGNYFLDNYEKDIISMVEKDYNHPSVIFYSIGNEVTEPARPEGVLLAQKIVEAFHALDRSRAVTGGINLTLILMAMIGKDLFSEEKKPLIDINSETFNTMAQQHSEKMLETAASDDADRVCTPLLNLLDIAGYNYANSRYDIEGKIHPERILVGSETYMKDLPENWRKVLKYPYLVGDFMWAAWDYIGEAGVGSWNYESDGKAFRRPYPWLLADVGAFDILGNDNAEAGMARAVWDPEAEPYIGVVPVNQNPSKLIKATWRCTNALPYWSYDGCDGEPATVEVYSGAEKVELLLNGNSLGKKSLEKNRAVYCLPYEPGELSAIAYRSDGTIHSRKALRSATGKTRIALKTQTIGNLIWVDVSLRGENDEIECAKDTQIRVSVEDGVLLAFGSAKPRTEENFLSRCYSTWYGRAQAVVLKQSETVVFKAISREYSTIETIS